MGYREGERLEDHVQLPRYLQSWGLREFRDEISYYEWQRSILSKEELRELERLIKNRQGGEDVESEMEFYDVLARRDLLPVLYSQRFDYYATLGTFILQRIPPAERVLDFGCGVGLLTIFFASQFPNIEFVGVDRSSRSLSIARAEAEKRQIRNIHFEVMQVPQDPLTKSYDLILSLQSLFQAEREPGLPSGSWRTFQRPTDSQGQEQIARRTGLLTRLEALTGVLRPKGRMVLFEKTWHLGRRVLFQRTLEASGLYPVVDPIFCRFRQLDEVIIDGPLYEVAKPSEGKVVSWSEDPYWGSGETLYRCAGLPASRMGQEMSMSQVCKTVSRKHSSLGSWTFRFGLWNEVMAWGMYEAESGSIGLILGAGEDKDLIFQLVETLQHLEEEAFERLIHDFWGNVFCADDEPSLPCYENHHPSAQMIFENLPAKIISQESTIEGQEGRETHIELGTSNRLVYLYWANTFDHRQIVIIDEQRKDVLQAYYQELCESS